MAVKEGQLKQNSISFSPPKIQFKLEESKDVSVSVSTPRQLGIILLQALKQHVQGSYFKIWNSYILNFYSSFSHIICTNGKWQMLFFFFLFGFRKCFCTYI